MFPKISDLINYLFGTHIDIPVQSYGFMVAMAFLSGAFVLYLELKRKERAGEIPAQTKEIVKGVPASFQELLLSGFFGFLIGWKGGGIVLFHEQFNSNPQDYMLSGEGSWWIGLIMAVIFAGYTYYRKYKAKLPEPIVVKIAVHPYQLTGNIFLIAAIFGLIGSKLFDVVEHLDLLFSDPIGTLFSFSGLSFYGGLIVAAFAVAWYCERNKIRTPYIGDAIAPALILAYAIGRIGCQLSGDGCWGVVNTQPMPEWLSWLPSWVWSFEYPHNVINEGVRMAHCHGEHCYILPYPVYPTPLYETTMGLIIFGILWAIRKRLPVPGYVFSVYLILNGIERFLIEEIRVNIPYEFLGMKVTQAQIIAIFLILLGISSFWIWKWLQKRVYKPFEPENPPE
jgi:phosphatidylglycerol---prolipoprotein diacylglyceryl transferase